MKKLKAINLLSKKEQQLIKGGKKQCDDLNPYLPQYYRVRFLFAKRYASRLQKRDKPLFNHQSNQIC